MQTEHNIHRVEKEQPSLKVRLIIAGEKTKEIIKSTEHDKEKREEFEIAEHRLKQIKASLACLKNLEEIANESWGMHASVEGTLAARELFNELCSHFGE